MKDVLKRAARTFAQAFVGTLTTVGIATILTDTSTLNTDAATALLVSASVAGASATLSFVQNLLEDSTGKTGLK